jgi:ribonuclease HII
VVAAAVVLPLDDPIEGLNDSKLLTPRQRERVFLAVKERARAVQVAIVSPETIDRINIYQATRAAMAEAVQAVSPSPDYLLIDGTIRLDLNIPQRAIVKGDRLSVSVAAAGVVAKVTRDRLMMELHEQYPEYGFNAHKGYATKAHKEAIRRHGPCPAHRKCFRGVKEHLLPPLFNGE